MAALPKRGETGKMKRIHCVSDEMHSFLVGEGPTGFTGFYTYEEFCFLVKDGTLIQIIDDCWKALQNTDDNRFIQALHGFEDRYFY